MTLLGSAIALTGRSVPFAFLIAAVLVVGYAIPKILICGAARVRGGEYTMVAMLAGTRMIVGVDVMAKFQNVIVILLCLALGVFAAFGVTRIQPDYFTNGFLTKEKNSPRFRYCRWKEPICSGWTAGDWACPIRSLSGL